MSMGQKSIIAGMAVLQLSMSMTPMMQKAESVSDKADRGAK